MMTGVVDYGASTAPPTYSSWRPLRSWQIIESEGSDVHMAGQGSPSPTSPASPSDVPDVQEAIKLRDMLWADLAQRLERDGSLSIRTYLAICSDRGIAQSDSLLLWREFLEDGRIAMDAGFKIVPILKRSA